MMIETPKSLTAIVHMRFHYEELKSKLPSEGEIEILAKLMDQASELDPDLQEILIKFASHLKKTEAPGGQT